MRRRGADPDDILDFRVSFPGAAVGAEWRGDELPAPWGHSCCILIGDAPPLVLYVFFKDTLPGFVSVPDSNPKYPNFLTAFRCLEAHLWTVVTFGTTMTWQRFRGSEGAIQHKSGSVCVFFLKDQTNVLTYKPQILWVLYYLVISFYFQSASLKSAHGQQIKSCFVG